MGSTCSVEDGQSTIRTEEEVVAESREVPAGEIRAGSDGLSPRTQAAIAQAQAELDASAPAAQPQTAATSKPQGTRDALGGSQDRTLEQVQAELTAAMRERDTARIRELMNERTSIQQRRREEEPSTTNRGPSREQFQAQGLNIVETKVKEWLSGDGVRWNQDEEVIAWMKSMVEVEGSGWPQFVGVPLKARMRKKNQVELSNRDSLPQRALLCEEAWAVAHFLWTQAQLERLPSVGFWNMLMKALREEAHAKLVPLSNHNRACEQLKLQYDDEIVTYYNSVPPTYICAICGADDSEHIHDSRITSTYTFGCGHQACTVKLALWLESQLAGGTQAAGLRCPHVDLQTGTRCNAALSEVRDEGGVSNLPQMLQELLPTEVSERVFQQMAEATPNLIFCPRTTCSAAWWLDNEELTNVRIYPNITCQSCTLRFCVKCPHGPHGGSTCERHKREKTQWREVEGTHEDQALLGKFSKPCPKCGSMTLKDGGCRHITCPCGAHWCWTCEKVFPQRQISNHMFSVHNGWFDDRNRDRLQIPTR